MQAIATKLDKYRNPWQELRIQYGPAKGKAYTEEEDRFLVCMMHRLGYGAWDELKAEIRNHWRFRFDWFFKSRTPQVGENAVHRLLRSQQGTGGRPARAARLGLPISVRDGGSLAARARAAQELSRRCETLIRLIEKENEEDDAAAGGKKARGPKKAGGGDSQAPSGEPPGGDGPPFTTAVQPCWRCAQRQVFVEECSSVFSRARAASDNLPPACTFAQRAGAAASARPTARGCPRVPSAARRRQRERRLLPSPASSPSQHTTAPHNHTTD